MTRLHFIRALLPPAVAALAAAVACTSGAGVDAGPRDEEAEAPEDAGGDAGAACIVNCGTPCAIPDGGVPCCDVDGNVVGEMACFEDAGALCLTGDAAACP